MQNGKNYQYLCNICSTYDYKKETCKREDYIPAKKLAFEGKEYSVPNNYNKILTNIYGDYMKLPPVEERITHNPHKLVFDTEKQ